MAHLWTDSAIGWQPVLLEGDAFVLGPGGARLIGPCPAQGPAAGEIRLRLIQPEAGKESWLLLFPPGAGVRVNGARETQGIRVLRDRDEIQVPGLGYLYLSTERLARVEAYPAATQVAFCPRCRQPLQTGVAAVRCPACGVWHHESESEGLQCWTYSDKCGFPDCGQSTEFSTGFRWTPEAT